MVERDVTREWDGPWVPISEQWAVMARARVAGTDPEGRAPDFDMRFEVLDQVPECVEFTMRQRPGGRPIRSSDLKLFDLDGITTATYLGAAVRREIIAPDGSVDLRGPRERGEPLGFRNDLERRDAVKAIRSAQRGRRGATRAELEVVAKVYNDHFDGNPTAAVKRELDYSSMRTAARRVQQAREIGLLPKTSRGVKRKGEDQ